MPGTTYRPFAPLTVPTRTIRFQDNFHPENSHSDSHRTIRTGQFSPWTITTRKFRAYDNSQPENLQPRQFLPVQLPPGQLTPRTIPTRKIPTRTTSTRKMGTRDNSNPDKSHWKFAPRRIFGCVLIDDSQRPPPLPPNRSKNFLFLNVF